ncbi:MAG: hypothetical protein N3I35_11885 [Clostridia bacterium]|nr:hypothetical protein [Clostridia bacterium]
MKKLVLILVCAMLMTVFVAFNYLLWDKEQNTKSIKTLEVKNDNKDATIDALGRDIKNLEYANRDLNSKVKVLENNYNELQKKNDEMQQDYLKSRQLIESKDAIISVFKEQVDMKPLEAVIKKWVESIDRGQYETAYKLEYRHYKNSGEVIGLNEYSDNYKKAIKSIKIKSVKLEDEEAESEREGITFIAVLDVKKNEDASGTIFTDGINEKVFSVIYDKEKGGWIIADIFSAAK